jgi:hypothetical protein
LKPEAGDGSQQGRTTTNRRQGAAEEGGALPASSRQPRASAVWFAAALVVIYALLAGAPFIRGIPAAVGSIGVTVLFILAAMSGAAALAAISMSWLGEVLGMLACLGVWYVVAGIGESSDLGRALAVPAADVFFLVACVLAGRLLARILRDRNLLLPVCVVLALADVFTVFLGPTRLALEEMPELVSKLSIKLPRVGSAAGPEGVAGLVHLATMGPGDLVFLSFFFVAAVRFGLSVRASFAGIFMLVAVGLAIIVALPRPIPVPVLPLMAVGFLIANRGKFKLTRAEKRNLVVAAGFFAAVILAMWGLTRLAQ